MCKWLLYAIRAYNIRHHECTILIAGFNALWPLVLCLWLAWRIHIQLNEANIIGFAQALRRYVVYFKVMYFPFLVALAMRAFYSATALAKQSDPASTGFSVLGRWDVPGRLLTMMMPAAGNSNWRFIVGTMVYIAFYLILIFLPLTYALLIVGRSRRQKQSSIQLLEQAKGVPLPAKAAPSPKSPSPYLENELGVFLADRLLLRLGITTVDLIFLSAYMSLGAFSWQKIRSSVFDASAIGSSIEFSALYSWSFGTMSAVVVFLNYQQLLQQNDKSRYEHMLNPTNITLLVPLFVPVLLSIFLFGATIFPRIPFSMGGGEPRLIQLTFKNQAPQALSSKAYLIGESSQFLFAIHVSGTDSSTFQVNKDSLEAIEALSGDKPPSGGSVTPSHDNGTAENTAPKIK